jgi:hypothetical protein
MTHDPHFPTLEQIMNNNPFELVDTPWGHIEAWRASTLATGTMGALAQVYDVVKNDTANLAVRADAEEARTALIQHLCAKVGEFEQRFDALEARLAEAEDKRRADQEREAEFEEEIELPPDFRNEPPPSAIEDADNTHQHEPGGELHSVRAKSEEPDLEVEDTVGDLPKELEEPPDPVPEPRGRVYPQPTAISLNED